tara:strand:+ start:3545 stop:3850 length:306 start_codon:yes stop_codon:yes gene_type:complete
MPKEVALPIPLERWFTDVEKIEELRKVLDSEAFQTAVAILKDIAGPSNSTLSTDINENSNRHAWYAGYRDAFQDLHKLTKLRDKKQTVNQPEEWTHIATPQ